MPGLCRNSCIFACPQIENIAPHTSRKLKSVESVQQLKELFKEMETENNVGGGQAILRLLLNSTWFGTQQMHPPPCLRDLNWSSDPEGRGMLKRNILLINQIPRPTNRKICECILKWRTRPSPYLASLDQVG
jgi:hypothetical protein